MLSAKEFVAAATDCDFDIDVYFNKVVLDAKSILGILSLDHRNVLTVMFDLVVAISVGIVLAAMLFMKRMSEVTEVDSWKYIDE